MRVTPARLVVFVFVLCFLGGQLERAVSHHRGAVDASAGRTLDVVFSVMAALVVVALVMLVNYLRNGHPIPGHARALPSPPERPRPGPLEYSAETVKLGDGVMAGPSIALVDAEDGEDIPVLPGAGTLGAAHLELAGKGNDETT